MNTSSRHVGKDGFRSCRSSADYTEAAQPYFGQLRDVVNRLCGKSGSDSDVTVTESSLPQLFRRTNLARSGTVKSSSSWSCPLSCSFTRRDTDCSEDSGISTQTRRFSSSRGSMASAYNGDCEQSSIFEDVELETEWDEDDLCSRSNMCECSDDDIDTLDGLSITSSVQSSGYDNLQSPLVERSSYKMDCYKINESQTECDINQNNKLSSESDEHEDNENIDSFEYLPKDATGQVKLDIQSFNNARMVRVVLKEATFKQCTTGNIYVKLTLLKGRKRFIAKTEKPVICDEKAVFNQGVYLEDIPSDVAGMYIRLQFFRKHACPWRKTCLGEAFVSLDRYNLFMDTKLNLSIWPLVKTI